MATMKTGITIVTYRRPVTFLRLMFKRLFQHSGDIEVVLVSNSEDEEVEAKESSLQKEFPFTFLTNKSLMVLTARNQGTKHLLNSCQYFAEMDDDVLVTPGWLSRILEVMEKDKSIGIAVPLMNFSPAVWYKGQVIAIPQEVTNNIKAIACNKDYSTHHLDKFWQETFSSKKSSYKEIMVPEITIQVKSKKAVEAGCLWDEHLDGACVEANAVLARSIREAGMKVVSVKNSFVFHLQTSTHSNIIRYTDYGSKLHTLCCQYIQDKFGGYEGIYDFDSTDPEGCHAPSQNSELFYKHARENLEDP